MTPSWLKESSMAEKQYDAIVIGAGHNGLTAAAYLSRAKKKVLVLERRAIVGGSVVTESFGDGFNADSVWTGGTLRPDIVKDLKLGLDTPTATRPPFISLQAGADHLVLDPDSRKAAESIRRFSEKDAAKWPDFVAFMDKAAGFLEAAYDTLMPRLPKDLSLEEGLGLAELGLDLRLTGGADMMRIVRGLPMTAEELADDWFESDALKAAVASLGIHGFTLGPMGAGTGFTLMHNWLNRGGPAHVNVGGAGRITQALADCVRAAGGEIRTDADVKQVTVRDMRATGVLLKDGEEIPAKVVLSALDPKRTFLSLVGPMELPPEFVWKVQSIKMRGSVAKVHLLTDGRHGLPDGTVALAPSIKYLERAYDAAKYHQISEQPYLEVTTSGSVVSIHFQYAPYRLKNGSWNMENGTIEKRAVDTLAEFFPNLKSSIKNSKIITPLDLEQTYGLTEGDLNHGQLLLDQFMFMRPLPGWSNHKTPIDGLYLCGSGVHGGGGVSGAAGRNVIKVLK
jgi:phytoene dehydrogenase-like protein